MWKLLLSSWGEEVSNSPWKFSATLKKASLVTKIKQKIGSHNFFKGHFLPQKNNPNKKTQTKPQKNPRKQNNPPTPM